MTLRLALLLAVAGLCLTIVAKHPMFVIGGAALFGCAVSLNLRPSLQRLPADRRRPSGDEIEAIVIGVAAALGLWVLFGLLFSHLDYVVDWPAPATRRWVGQFLGVLPVLPLVLAMGRQARHPAPENGRTSGASALAALPLAFGSVFIWLTAIDVLAGKDPPYLDLFHAILLTPTYVFWIVAGGAFVADGVRETPAISAFSQAITASMAAWILVALVTLGDIARVPALYHFSRAEGGGLGCAYVILVSAGWVRGLWSLRRLDEGRAGGTAMAVAILGIGMSLTVVIPMLVVGATWGDLVAVVMFPFALGSAAIATFMPTLLCRRLLGLQRAVLAL